VRRKIQRVESIEDPAVKVFVSNYWTLEYDLAMSGLAELMFVACSLAECQKSRGERLTETDEKTVETSAKAAWPAWKAKHKDDVELAVAIYKPLYEKDASKAVTAEYAAKLLRTGRYGSGATLLNALPLYLKAALQHLTGTTDPVATAAPTATTKATATAGATTAQAAA
jgi:putative ATP-dependent endonuclease of OLD family